MWTARIYVRTIDGRTVTREFVAANRDEALAKLQRAKDAGLLRRDQWSDRPLRDFATQWLESLVGKIKPTTLHWYRLDVEKQIVPALGSIRLGDLSVLSIARFIEELLLEDVGRAAVARSMRCLSAMLSEAVATEQIESNPALKLSRQQRPRYRAPEAKTLTAEQLELLFAAITGRYAAAVITAAMTGLRQGEILGLRWGDIDFARARAAINRNIVQIGTITHELEPKTESSRRTIALPRRVVTALRVHKEAMKREGSDINAEAYIFRTQMGTAPARSHLLRKVLRPALKRAGLPTISWRELRHTFASASIEMGVPAEALSRSLGHANVSTTHRVYNKALRARETLVADAWEARDEAGRSNNTVSDTVSNDRRTPEKANIKARKKRQYR